VPQLSLCDPKIAGTQAVIGETGRDVLGGQAGTSGAVAVQHPADVRRVDGPQFGRGRLSGLCVVAEHGVRVTVPVGAGEHGHVAAITVAVEIHDDWHRVRQHALFAARQDLPLPPGVGFGSRRQGASVLYGDTDHSQRQATQAAGGCTAPERSGAESDAPPTRTHKRPSTPRPAMRPWRTSSGP